jgi:hypothetical protein
MTNTSSTASGKLAPPQNLPWLGITANEPYQSGDSVFDFEGYRLSIVEFDDEGRCYDRRQMVALAGELERLSDTDAIIVVFVHGWKHTGRSNDDNLENFMKVLKNTAQQQGPDGLPVLGVFVAWRGLSLFGLWLDNLTFWDRKQAGLRVSTGSPRELLGRLRHFKYERKRKGGEPLLVIIGHSFGGMIVYSALAQSLIEAASLPAHQVVPSFADLVLLVNPAFEAVRYLPIYDLMIERDAGGYTPAQLPVFVSVTAVNDLATGLAFPAGMLISLLQERTRGWQERQALLHTMGHLAWMRTHRLSGTPSQTGTAEDIGGTFLQRTNLHEHNPFWVVSATPDVVNGHGGIWLPPFVNFVQAMVARHVRRAREKRLAGTRPPNTDE